MAELDPASTVKDGSVEATLATAQQSNTISVGSVLARSETILVLGALAGTVDPRLSLRLTARTPVVDVVGLHSDGVWHVLSDFGDRLMRKPILLPRAGCDP